MNNFNPKPNQYSKRNFHEALEIVTPDLYISKDIDLSGLGYSDEDQIINSNIIAATKIDKILPVSGLNNISSISQYFVKQNELTKITTQSFEDKILYPLGSSIDDFDTIEDFSGFLSSVLLRKIVPPSSLLEATIMQGNTKTSGVFGSNSSATHEYLIDNLGWFYFLNQIPSGLTTPLVYNPSSYVLEKLTGLYLGQQLDTLDGIKGFVRHLWYNYKNTGLNSIISSNKLIPINYLSGTATYTSGTQQLDKLETMIEVIYSTSYMDRDDFKVKTAFDDYIAGIGLLETTESKGPFRKLLQAIGYSMADVNNQIQTLESLYDLQDCPEEYLQYLAQLIDWRLLGSDPSKWRHQLRSAVDVYKRKGTLPSIQYALNALIVGESLDVSSQVDELWESYLPFMLWYSLATESRYFKNLQTWTKQKAEEAGIFEYDNTSLENNIKIAVDYILLEAYINFPNNFVYEGKYFPVHRYVTLDNNTGLPADNKIVRGRTEIYSLVTEPRPRPVYFNEDYNSVLTQFKVNENAENLAYENSFHDGPSGLGSYLASESYNPNVPTIYLSSTGDPAFVFNFRQYRNFPIPPFEEIKYYKNCDITKDLAEFLTEKLKCLGVEESFANSFLAYIKNSSYGSLETVHQKNNFLMFFSGMQIPSNYFKVLQNTDAINNGTFSLWNGKSSHMFINLLASDFDFLSRNFTGDSKYAIQAAKNVLDKFLPAHAIPNISLEIANTQDPFSVANTSATFVHADQTNTMYSLLTGAFAGYELSGVSMGLVSPGTDTGRGGLNTFQRTDVDSYTDALVSSVNYLTNVPRKSLRRRNYRFTLPLDGYYGRTGFNQPITFDASVLERSTTSSTGILPLGYVPSSNSYYPVYDSLNPSGVWAHCENLSSDNSYFDVAVSNTFPSRGLSALGSDVKYDTIPDRHDRYVDRGYVDPIFIVMHSLKEKEAFSKAQVAVSADTSSYYGDIYSINHIQSLANGYINSGIVGINSFSDYENFRFGSGLHRLFSDYKKNFNHTLSENKIDETGANIFSHTFGPLLYNAKLEVEGSAVTSQEGKYIASSLDSIIPISYGGGSGVFSVCAVQNGFASGTYVASTINSMPIVMTGGFSAGVNGVEFRNPHILSGVEFVQTSGASISNKFEIIKLDSTLFSANSNNYVINKPFIKCFTNDGFPRLRFDLSSYGATPNKFIKDHLFKFSLKGQIADERFAEFGGGRVGVWIHTNPIQGADGNYYIWSWTRRNRWELVNFSRLNCNIIKQDLSISYSFKNPIKPDYEVITGTRVVCLGNSEVSIPDVSSIITADPFLDIQEDYLETFEFNFDTRNFTIYNNYEYLQIIPVPEVYYKIKNQVHSENTNYFVEVFYYPSQEKDKYLLIDTISIQDLTLKSNSGIGTGYGIPSNGIPLYPFVEEFKYYTNPEELRVILKFFNKLTQNVYSTRDASISSGILNTSGGSRLNYRTRNPSAGSVLGTLDITN